MCHRLDCSSCNAWIIVFCFRWFCKLICDSGILCDECRNIFRVKTESDSEGKLLRLHSHQADAVRIASGGHSYVLTTGTGSGKIGKKTVGAFENKKYER